MDTRFPMLIGLTSIWLIGMPWGYLFAFPLRLGPIGVISGWMCGILLGAVILYYRWCSLSINLSKYNCEVDKCSLFSLKG